MLCFSLIIGIANYSSIDAETSENAIKNGTITKIKNTDPFYIATSGECTSSKQVKSYPYVVVEDKCTENATIKNIGKVINNVTFLNTVIDNNTIIGQGKGKIVSEDGQMIGWESYDVNPVVAIHPGYTGIIYFNSTIDEKFSFLNNTIGIYRSDADTVRSIWLLE